MLKTRVVRNIGELIYDYVIPTMWTSAPKQQINLNCKIYQSDKVQKLLR